MIADSSVSTGSAAPVPTVGMKRRTIYSRTEKIDFKLLATLLNRDKEGLSVDEDVVDAPTKETGRMQSRMLQTTMLWRGNQLPRVEVAKYGVLKHKRFHVRADCK